MRLNGTSHKAHNSDYVYIMHLRLQLLIFLCCDNTCILQHKCILCSIIHLVIRQKQIDTQKCCFLSDYICETFLCCIAQLFKLSIKCAKIIGTHTKKGLLTLIHTIKEGNAVSERLHLYILFSSLKRNLFNQNVIQVHPTTHNKT